MLEILIDNQQKLGNNLQLFHYIPFNDDYIPFALPRISCVLTYLLLVIYVITAYLKSVNTVMYSNLFMLIFYQFCTKCGLTKQHFQNQQFNLLGIVGCVFPKS